MKSEEGGTSFDGVWLKPVNEMPSKSSTLPMPVVVVVFDSSLVSMGFPPSSMRGFFVVFVTGGTAGLFSFRIVRFWVVDVGGISVGFFIGVVGWK